MQVLEGVTDSYSVLSRDIRTLENQALGHVLCKEDCGNDLGQ